MNFFGFEGNDQIKTALAGELSCQSFLLEGPEGSGRHTLANILTSASVCSSSSNRPCGVCAGCRKVKSGSHLDVMYIPSDIRVDALRQVLEKVPVYPNEGQKKVYIIDDAEKLGTVQQNILLKTLEEPPAFVVFILICFAKEGLLETIRSRCMVLTLKPLSVEDAESFLKKKYGSGDRDRIHLSALGSGGYLGRAVAEYENGESGVSSKCVQIALCIATGDYLEATTSFSAEKDREKYRDLVAGTRDVFRRGLCDASQNRISGGDRACIQSLGIKKLSGLCEMFDTVSEKIRLNVNMTLWSVYIAKECSRICGRKGNL